MMAPQTWWGVLNPQGQLSQLFSMRGLAESALGERHDRDDCRLVSAEVTISDVRSAPKKGKKR
jgi:hypothetical protein